MHSPVGRGPGHHQPPPVPSTPETFYASPTGLSSNDGSVGAPWSLEHAFSGAGGVIGPGDTVLLRGGTYTRSATTAVNERMYEVTVNGVADEPVTYRSYPGEWAVIDDPRGAVIETYDGTMSGVWVTGDHVHLRDIEIKSSYTTRETATVGEHVLRGGELDLVGDATSAINVILHDGVQGAFVSSVARGSSLIGAIIYNYGVEKSDQAYGHAVYSQSFAPDTQTLEDVIFAGGYNYNLHIYTGGANTDLHGYTVRNCTSVDGSILANLAGGLAGKSNPGGGDLWGGSVSGRPLVYSTIDGHFHDGGLFIGDQTRYPDNIRVRNCFFISTGSSELRGVTNIKELKNNILVKNGNPNALRFDPIGGRSTTFSPASASDIDDNDYYVGDAPLRTFYLPDGTVNATLADWQAYSLSNYGATYDANSTVTNGLPADFASVVANPAETGRGTVRIFKASGTASMDVDLSTILTNGDDFWLYDGRNPLDGAFASGTYDGSDVTITFADMPGRAIPVGWSSAPTGNEATHPVVIVRRVGPTWVAPSAELVV